MEILRSLTTGTRVEARGEPWLVVQAEAFDDCVLVTLRGAGEENVGTTTALLAPFDRLSPHRQSTGLELAGRRRAFAHAASAVARAHGWSESWTAPLADIDLLPWQLEPATAAVCGATRLLLADDVGLGKTVQAGLVISELRARGLINRALILTPASLREQWAAELRDRFRLSPKVFDHATLASLAGTLPLDVNPWATTDLVVSSIDLVKRAEVRAALDQIAIDLLVVDEAHHLKPGTDRAAVVSDLASRSTWLILATATPHSGDEPAYAFLRALGSSPGDEPRVFRRSAAEVGRPRCRRVRFTPVQTEPLERALLDNTLAYARSLWRAGHNDARAILVASVICRRAVSSPGALATTLRRRRALLADADAGREEAQHELPWLEHDDQDGVESDDILGSSRLADTASEIRRLDDLLSLAIAASGSSAKFAALARRLVRAHEPAIVFSEYRDTLLDLAQVLDRRVTTTCVHGGLSALERQQSIRRFLAGDAQVLLATDAAGEGLNLQARCRLVINIELPWNPVRLAQRLGRVDRLGQTRRVHAIHLYYPDSFEEQVFLRLHERMQAAGTLGGFFIGAREAAAAVFDDRPLPVPTPHAAPAVAAAEASSPAALRRAALLLWRHRRRGSARPRQQQAAPVKATRAVCAPLPRRHAHARSFTLLFERDFHDRDGRSVARDLVAVSVRLSRPIRVHRRNVRPLTMALATAPRVLAVLNRQLTARTAQVRHEVNVAARAIVERLDAIQQSLAVASRPLQRSLFDRRAEQEARARADAREALRSHASHRRALALALQDVVASDARLIAAWPSAEAH